MGRIKGLNLKKPIQIYCGENEHACTKNECLNCKYLKKCKLIFEYDEKLEKYTDKHAYYKIKKEEEKTYINKQFKFLDSIKEQEKYINKKFTENIKLSKTNNNKIKLIYLPQTYILTINTKEIKINSPIEPEKLKTIKTNQTYQKLKKEIQKEIPKQNPEKILDKLLNLKKAKTKEKEEIINKYKNKTIKEKINTTKENIKNSDKKQREYEKLEKHYEKLVENQEKILRKKAIKRIKNRGVIDV